MDPPPMNTTSASNLTSNASNTVTSTTSTTSTSLPPTSRPITTASSSNQSSINPSAKDLEKFNILKSDMQQILETTAEVELERDEHTIVLKAMKPMAPDRKCFRQFNGVLISSTVSEAVPYLEFQLVSINKVLEQLSKQKEAKQKEIMECQQRIGSLA